MALKLTDIINVTQANSGGKQIEAPLSDAVTLLGTDTLRTDVDGLQAIAPIADVLAIATAASIFITFDAIATASKFITIGNKTYTFVAALTAPAVANEVLVAGNVSNQAAYLKAAINAEAGAGSTYGTGTTAHTQVSVTAIDGAKITVTMKVKGVDGVTITHNDNPAFDINSPVDLTGEVAGTVGSTGAIVIDVAGGNLYICSDGTKCTTADSSGWKKTAIT